MLLKTLLWHRLNGLDTINMTEFLISLAVFLLAHVVPPAPPVRNRLIGWMGRRAYLIAYSILSTVLLGWVILAAQKAPFTPVWNLEIWHYFVPLIVMPFAIWLLISGLIEPNPLSISLRKRSGQTQTGLAAKITRHPVLLGFLLWGVSHIPANGDVIGLIMFGGVVLLAVGGVFMVDRRAKKRLGADEWQALAAGTSLIPLGALFAGRASLKPTPLSWLLIVISLLVYAWILLSAHALFIGVDPMAGIVI